MIHIGLLSDTHGFIDDRIISFFEPCAEIWHAGDLGNLEIADRLHAIKPLRAVHGNIDDYMVRTSHPLYQSFTIEQVKVLMTHIGGYPGHYDARARVLIEQERPTLFIAGHSHILKVQYDKKYGLLHMNPGAAGNSGFHQVKTALRFVINGAKIEQLEVLELDRVASS